MTHQTETDFTQTSATNKAVVTYWQLVRLRFLRNRYAVAGMIGSLMIVLFAILPGFFAPYGAQTKDRDAIFSPPQLVRIWSAEDGLTQPHVLGFEEVMDNKTFAITFVPDPAKRTNIVFFPKGEEWTFLGLTFERHLFGGEDGRFVHLLGTDGLGRDVFSRLVQGTAITMLMATLVMTAAGIIGTIVGVSSGYFGGTYDLIVQRIVEFVKSFPDLPLYLALVALLPRRADPVSVFVAFAMILVLLRWADLGRELRGKVIATRRVDYVRAAVAVGASDRRIILRHIIPNTSSHVIVWATYSLPEIILLESFLSFLGVGVQQPMVSWGAMLNQVRDFQALAAAPWLLAPVGLIIIAVLSFNALGDGLRDALDPYAHD